MGDTATETATEVITLEKWLAAWIDQLSDPAQRVTQAAMYGDNLVLRMGGIAHKPARGWAEIVLQSDGGQPVVLARFGNGPRPRGRLDRVTEVPFAALLACGLLAEGAKPSGGKK